MNLEPWERYVASLDFEPLFVTISGAHIYGFPSPDSDVDLRGAHQLPLEQVVGLTLPAETLDRDSIEDGVEVDIVSHEIGKYLRLLIKNNGYILEQVFSPLVVSGHEFLDRLRPIARRCVTKFHVHHYRGFYATKRKDLEKQPVKKAKSLLYAYRVLMTGIHLMNSGEVVTDIRELNETISLPFIDDLIAAKSREKIELEGLDWEFHKKELDRLEAKLDEAFDSTQLGENRDMKAVNDLLVDMRLQQFRV